MRVEEKKGRFDRKMKKARRSVKGRRNVMNVGAKDGSGDRIAISPATAGKSVWKSQRRKKAQGRETIYEGKAGEKVQAFFSLLFLSSHPFSPFLFLHISFLYAMLPASQFPPVGKSTAINIGNALYCYFALHQTKGRKILVNWENLLNISKEMLS